MCMRKWKWSRIVMVFFVMLFLAACGGKSQESVLSKIEEKLEEADGYKVKAEMLMRTGQDEQVYEIDVWHKKQNFYRISLTNPQDEKGGQVILKNEEGVFVLTPALKKSFKFQSDWPDNSSQPYLLQSLVKDVVNDKEAVFETTDQHYIFQTKTNYQNNTLLPFQEIYFDKKEYTPVLVKVLDKDKKSQVEVRFSRFENNPDFATDDFKTEETLASLSATAEETVVTEAEEMPFTVMLPLYTAGSELVDKKEVETDEGKRVILTFAGEKNFTLVQQEEPTVETATTSEEVKGDMIHLGHAIGFITNQVIEWSKDGTHYMLASDELTKEELIEVAQSVQGQEVK